MTKRELLYVAISIALGSALAGVISVLLRLPDQWTMLLGMVVGGAFTYGALRLAERTGA
jgi:hypothetical protein